MLTYSVKNVLQTYMTQTELDLLTVSIKVLEELHTCELRDNLKDKLNLIILEFAADPMKPEHQKILQQFAEEVLLA